jgi:RimJ/RimL family protein N-acetyltransferase
MDGLVLLKMNQDLIQQSYIDTLNDSEYMKFSRQRNFKHTLKSSIEYLESFNLNSNGHFYALCKSDNDLIGTATIYLNPEEKSANLGFLILKNYANTGYGKLLFTMLVFELIKMENVFYIEIGTSWRNLSMRKIAERFNLYFHKSVNNDDFLNSPLIYYRGILSDVLKSIDSTK